MHERKNSHITLSQTLLNGFSQRSHNGKIIYILNVSTFKITEKKVKLYNTSPGYYSEETEKKLSDLYETKMGEIRKKN